MAFRFRTRDPSRLFFPTVHVHDGRVHAEARFDHALYYQHPHLEADARGSLESGGALSFMPWTKDYRGLVSPGEPVARRRMRGMLPNRDTWVALATSAP